MQIQKWYIPDIKCYPCYFGILKANKNKKFKYQSPVNWLKIARHIESYCYFCQSAKFIKKVKYENRESIKYFNNAKVIPAKKHPLGEATKSTCSEDMEDSETSNENCEINFAEEPHLITQSDFNDLVKNTKITQRSAEILASRSPKRSA